MVRTSFLTAFMVLGLALTSPAKAMIDDGYSGYNSGLSESAVRGYDIYGSNIEWLETDLALECAEDMVFFDDNFGGMVCGEKLYISYDGGRAWEPIQGFENSEYRVNVELDGIEVTPSATILMTGTIAYGGSQAQQKALVVVRSEDMGATFTQNVVDTGLPMSIEAASPVTSGDYVAFGAKDGSVYFVSADQGATWTKTQPPYEPALGLPAVAEDGFVTVLRTRSVGESTRRGLYKCKMQIGVGEWGCQNTLLQTSSLDQSEVYGRFLADAEGKLNLFAFGMDNSVFGGIFKPDNKNAGLWIKSLGTNATCLDFQALNSSKVVAVCHISDVPAKITTVVFSSSNSGVTWKKDFAFEDTVDAKVFLHRLEDQTYEVILYGAGKLQIGKFK